MSDKTSDKLLPCPFCGGEAKWSNALHNYIECKECGFETIWYDTEAEAITIWNTRKPMERIVERLEAEKGESVMYCHARMSGRTLRFGRNIGIDKAIEIVKEEM